MHELSKSIMRRLTDSNFLRKYFRGEGIDIGAGPDSLWQYREFFPGMVSVRAWDLPDGDAQLMKAVPPESFDFVHSSHCLEHLHDPEEALLNWFRILRPGGHLVVMVPDEDMYEQGIFPSTFNSDHKWTFTMFKSNSWNKARSRNVLSLLTLLGDEAEVVKVEMLSASFRHGLPRIDQTLTPVGECAIEFVLRKRTAREIALGGRFRQAV